MHSVPHFGDINSPTGTKMAAIALTGKFTVNTNSFCSLDVAVFSFQHLTDRMSLTKSSLMSRHAVVNYCQQCTIT